MDDTEQTLLDAAARGDQGAFHELYARNVNTVHRFARGMGVLPGELEDAVQEVFITAFRRIGEFDGKAKLSTWLYAIAVRVCKARSRKSYWRAVFGDVLAREPGPPGPDRPDAAAAQSMDREFVARVMEKMSEKKRTVLVMREMMEMSEDETAAALGISRGTAATRLFHARQEFAKIARRLAGASAEFGSDG